MLLKDKWIIQLDWINKRVSEGKCFESEDGVRSSRFEFDFEISFFLL